MKEVGMYVIGVYFFVMIIASIGNIGTWGWFISKKTERKYLAHIHQYRNWEDGGISLPYYEESDSLSYMHVTMDNGFGFPFAKWAIYGVGLIPRWSKLSHQLDSINNAYKRRFK